MNNHPKKVFEMKEPSVNVCVLQETAIRFSLNGDFLAKGDIVSGSQMAECKDGCVLWNGKLYQELLFLPQTQQATFDIHHVRIGINFHWEREETQTFKGALKMMVNDGKICAVNIVLVEDYLISVISSEMSATASLEFLKSHAVISRSWLMAQMEKRRKLSKMKRQDSFFSYIKKDNSLIRWYDRQDHTLFDVCADDHCQRYQGLHRVVNHTAEQAVRQTRGIILTYQGGICDARFSKCCGGVMEKFSACWEDRDFPYLQPKKDWIGQGEGRSLASDLTAEAAAVEWIKTNPTAFCNTLDKRILSMVLNTYDQETTDFYRWQVRYSQNQIAELLKRKTKIDFGQILDLVPVQRGESARVSLLRIVGTNRAFTIGKELEIRRVLSESHLKSSAFFVEKVFGEGNPDVPEAFVLHGAGWGHGVGLCQIGAAVMGERGFGYEAILSHYYPNAELTTIYT